MVGKNLSYHRTCVYPKKKKKNEELRVRIKMEQYQIVASICVQE